MSNDDQLRRQVSIRGKNGKAAAEVDEDCIDGVCRICPQSNVNRGSPNTRRYPPEVVDENTRRLKLPNGSALNGKQNTETSGRGSDYDSKTIDDYLMHASYSPSNSISGLSSSESASSLNNMTSTNKRNISKNRSKSDNDDADSVSESESVLIKPTSGLSVDRKQLRQRHRRKLILHFDVRNTIIVFDSATHDDVEQALNSFLTGVTWGSEDPLTGGWTWRSDRPSLRAPCPGAITYYKSQERSLVRSPADRVVLRRLTGDFTRQAIGQQFRPFFDKHLQLLEWKFPSQFRNGSAKPDFVGVACNGSRTETGNHLAIECHISKKSQPESDGKTIRSNNPADHRNNRQCEEKPASENALCQKEIENPNEPEVVTDRRLTISSADGRLYHYLLPSFVKLLYDLHSADRHFAVVLRTYGVDAPKVLESIEHIVAGNHPLFPGRRIPVHVNRTPGRVLRNEGGQIRFELIPSEVSRFDFLKSLSEDISVTPNLPVVNGAEENAVKPEGISSQKTEVGDGKISTAAAAEPEVYRTGREIYRMLSGAEGVSGFVDHFSFWQSHDYHHAASKPLWIDPGDADVQHIFFDDNLRVTDEDSIVDVKVFEDDGAEEARSLDQTEIASLERVCLVQADLLQCTSNINYFSECVDECEHNYDGWLIQRQRNGMRKDDEPSDDVDEVLHAADL